MPPDMAGPVAEWQPWWLLGAFGIEDDATPAALAHPEKAWSRLQARIAGAFDTDPY